MTWSDAIEISKTGRRSWIDVDEFANNLSLVADFDRDAFERRFSKRWVKSWVCTDTEVGVAVVWLDEEPVAASLQPARKSDEEILFFSPELAAKVREVLLSLIIPGWRAPASIDPAAEVDPWFMEDR